MSEEQVPPTPPSSPPPGPPPPPPPDAPPPPPAGGDSGNRTLMLILAYLGPLALIPFLTEQNDREVHWHSKHGLVLAVCWIVVSLALGTLGMIPFLGCLAVLALPIVALGITVLHIVMIVKAVNGERFTLPLISAFADKF